MLVDLGFTINQLDFSSTLLGIEIDWSELYNITKNKYQEFIIIYTIYYKLLLVLILVRLPCLYLIHEWQRRVGDWGRAKGATSPLKV